MFHPVARVSPSVRAGRHSDPPWGRTLDAPRPWAGPLIPARQTQRRGRQPSPHGPAALRPPAFAPTRPRPRSPERPIPSPPQPVPVPAVAWTPPDRPASPSPATEPPGATPGRCRAILPWPPSGVAWWPDRAAPQRSDEGSCPHRPRWGAGERWGWGPRKPPSRRLRPDVPNRPPRGRSPGPTPWKQLPRTLVAPVA